jgi:hypothetical protein
LARADWATSLQGFPFRLSSDPGQVLPGDLLVVEVQVARLTGASIEKLDLGPGLKLEESLIKPFADAKSGLSGTDLRLELRVLEAQSWRIASLALSGREGRFGLGPIEFARRPEAGASPEAAAPVWRWLAPERVYRYESFDLELSGPPSAAGVVAPLFEAPEGSTLEALPGSYLSWIGTALESGPLVLPEATIDAGKLSGRARARRIEVLPLPQAVEASRALGRFSLSLEGPTTAPPKSQDLLVFRLTLSGVGNLPSVRLPEPSISLDGRGLGSDAWNERRIDELAPAKGGYRGRSTLEVSLVAPGPGRLRLYFPPLAALDPDGNIASLAVAPLELRLLAPISGASSAASGDPFLSYEPGLAASLASREPGLARLPSLIGADKAGAALELLRGMPPELRAEREAVLLDAALAWKTGLHGEALAAVYGFMRRNPDDRDGRSIADRAVAIVGAGPALVDELPPPGPFILASALLALVGFGFFLAGRLRKRPRRPSPAFMATGGLLILAALALAGLGIASKLERRREFAVAWTDSASAVPSPLAENTSPLTRGQSALVIGRAEGYICLRFADGSVGWVAHGKVYSY